MAPAAEWMIRARTSSVPSLSRGADDGFRRTAHVRLDDHGQFGDLLGAELGHHVGEGVAAHRTDGLLALHPLAVFGQLAGSGFVLTPRPGASPGSGASSRPRISTGTRGAGFGQLLVAFVDQGAHPAPGSAGHDDVGALQGAALDQDGGHRAPALVELGFDHHAFAGAIRIGAQVHHFSLKKNGFDQILEDPSSWWRRLRWPGCRRRGFPPRSLCWSSSLMTRGGIGVRLVDLVDGHDDRGAGRLGVIVSPRWSAASPRRPPPPPG